MNITAEVLNVEGTLWLRIIEQDGDNRHERDIPLSMIAAKAELVGTTSMIEAAEAEIHGQDHGEPPVDPRTGAGVWAEAWTLLAHREQVREEEAVRVRDEVEGALPATVRVRSSFAAYQAVHVPVRNGECVMDKCRRETRRRMGLADPDLKPGCTSRITNADATGGKTHRAAVIAAALEPYAEDLKKLRAQFLHSLTDSTDDPLSPTAGDPSPVSVDSILAKYQEAH